ncbi:MAG TPA: energy transducer TonB [Xanthomonadaceae bacterium]|nr:energy transducer TonB [Xanthomonadaceae bacterium]
MKPEQGRPLSAAVRATAVVALLCALAACKKDAADDAAATPADQAAASGEPAAPVEAVSAEVASMDADALRAAASAALREQRLYAPAGNNAMEYYLALRDKQPQDPSVASALTDLMPYTLIATEQSIGREDFDEAQRLYALMEKTNPDAPALPRLEQTIATARQQVVAREAQEVAQTQEEEERQADLEAEREREQQQAQQEAARQLAAQQAAARAAEEQRQREAQAAAASAPTQSAPTQSTAEPAAATPARTANTELIPVSTPAPQFPAEAYRNRQSGEVQVEFVVGTNGSVTSSRVVRSNPRRVFDRAALDAVNRWRFQPVAEPVTSRRTIGFDPEA